MKKNFHNIWKKFFIKCGKKVSLQGKTGDMPK